MTSEPSFFSTTRVKRSPVESMATIDEIDSKLELCMRIISKTLKCPSCSEIIKLEIDNFNNTITPKEGGPSLVTTENNGVRQYERQHRNI